MIILGLYPSQTTGWALYDTSSSLCTVRPAQSDLFEVAA